MRRSGILSVVSVGLRFDGTVCVSCVARRSAQLTATSTSKSAEVGLGATLSTAHRTRAAACGTARLNDGVLTTPKQMINFGGESGPRADESFRNIATPLRTFLLTNGTVSTAEGGRGEYNGPLGWCSESTSGEFVGGVTASNFLCAHSSTSVGPSTNAEPSRTNGDRATSLLTG